MDHLNLTHDILSVDDVMKKVSSEKCGAVSIFVGTTRDNFEGKKVVQLEYEAYETMALKVMKNLCIEIRNKWKDTHHIAIFHRLGVVPVMEASVIIAVSSPHRVDSLAAVQYCIENLKETDILIEPNDEQVSTSNLVDINPQLIQVNASNEEIDRRIKNFIERKREQINVCNIKDFIVNKNNIQDSDELTCARVDAVLVKQKGSKGHLKVLRVENEWGPQTKVKSKPSNVDSGYRSLHDGGIEERITNAEKHLNIVSPVSPDIYKRLKKIEDRILELESLSPEYISFWAKNQEEPIQEPSTSSDTIPRKKIKYTSNEIKLKMEALIE